MEPAQDRCGDERPTAPRHARRRLLVDALMRPRVIEVGDIGPQRPARMGLSQDQQMIRTLPADTAQEPFAVGIGPRSPVRRAQDLYAARFRTWTKCRVVWRTRASR